MGRLLIPLALVALAFWVFSVVDCAIQPPSRHRGASKRVWVLITLVPVVGGILWWTIGRSRGEQLQPVGASGPLAPDDDPRFTASDERIRRLEEELAMLDAEEAFGAPSADERQNDTEQSPDPEDPRDRDPSDDDADEDPRNGRA